MKLLFLCVTDTVKQQPKSPSPARKRKRIDERQSYEENRSIKSCTISVNKGSARKELDYQIGPPSWIKKEITTYMLQNILVSTTFSLISSSETLIEYDIYFVFTRSTKSN